MAIGQSQQDGNNLFNTFLWAFWRVEARTSESTSVEKLCTHDLERVTTKPARNHAEKRKDGGSRKLSWSGQLITWGLLLAWH